MGRAFLTASSQYFVRTSGVAVTAYPFALACWVRPSSLTQSGTMIALGSSVSTTQRATIQMNGTAAAPNSAFAAVTQGGTAGNNVNGTTVYSVGAWYHVACVWASATSRTLYVNGVAEGTSAVNIGTVPAWNEFYIGARRNATVGQYVSGDIAEAAAWSSDLTTREVKALAAGLSPIRVRPTALRHYVPLVGVGENSERDLCAAPAMSGLLNPGLTDHPRMYTP